MKKINFIVFMVLFIAVFSISGYAATTSQTVASTSIVISLVNQDPDPAFAGDTVEVRLSLENLGSVAAQNYVLELTPVYPFHLVFGENAVQDVGTLGPYQQGSDTKIIKFKVLIDKDSLAGQYPLNVLGYAEGKKDQFSVEKNFDISIKSKQNAQIIHIDKSSLLPGKESELKFTINNVGNSPLRDLTFYWQNPDGIILPVGSDNTRYVKYLDVGQSEDIDYNVMADTNADPGLYKLNLYLTYSDSVSGQTTTISTIAGMYVGGETDFEVAFSESASGSTSFSVANIGSNPAASVSVIIPEQRGWTVTGSNSVIIGNLNKGDYTVASFTLQSSSAMNFTRQGRNANNSSVPSNNQNPSAADQGNFVPRQGGNNSFNPIGMQIGNSVKLQIAYTDTMGQRKIIEKDVAISSSSRTGGNSTLANFGNNRRISQQNVFLEYKWYFIGAIVVVLAFIIFRKMKTRKNKSVELRNKDFLLKKK